MKQSLFRTISVVTCLVAGFAATVQAGQHVRTHHVRHRSQVSVYTTQGIGPGYTRHRARFSVRGSTGCPNGNCPR